MARGWVGIVAIAALGAACASSAGVGPAVVGFGEPPYPVGRLQIWIRPQPEVEILCRMARSDQPSTHRILGCYLAETRTIIAIDDAWVVMHEMKHFFEGRWHDDPGQPH